MNAQNIFRQPRGPRKANCGDAAAYPLMTARILYSIQVDAANGKVVGSKLAYFNEALGWFHSAVRERIFRFMLPVDEDKAGKIGRRPDEFRKQAGLVVDRLITLSVAFDQEGVAALTKDVRLAAERHLVARYLESLRSYDEYDSSAEFRHCLNLLRAGRTFSDLLAEAQFEKFCADLAYDHELRLRDFANLTSGLCT